MIIRNTIGLFLSPTDEIIINKGSHIEAVISNPELFGLTLDEIKEEYRKFGEEIPKEGKAREVLLKKVIRKGWIRLRRYRNQQWSVTVHQLDEQTINRIEAWHKKILKGVSGVKENDQYLPIVVTQIFSEQDTMVSHRYLFQ